MERSDLPDHFKISEAERMAAAQALELNRRSEPAQAMLECGKNNDIRDFLARMVMESIANLNGQATADMLRLQADYDALKQEL